MIEFTKKQTLMIIDALWNDYTNSFDTLEDLYDAISIAQELWDDLIKFDPAPERRRNQSLINLKDTYRQKTNLVWPNKHSSIR